MSVLADHAVPSPVPPDDPDAWYAPAVRSQYEVHPGVVVTVAERDGEFAYGVRTPPLGAGDETALARVTGMRCVKHSFWTSIPQNNL